MTVTPIHTLQTLPISRGLPSQLASGEKKEVMQLKKTGFDELKYSTHLGCVCEHGKMGSFR